MLQNYLNANLLPITDDGDFKKLKKSSDEIAKKLTKNKSKIVSYTLAAIDPDISVNNPDIIEVKEVIIKNWSTFASNAKDTPLTYIRAVILEALNSLTEVLNHSLIIWFGCRNITHHLKLTGNEKDIVLEFLSELCNQINRVANSEWALSNNNNSSKINVELKDITKYLVNDDTLIKYLEDAVGPSNKDGVANYASPNPHWPNANNSWSYEFPSRAAKGFKNAIDPCLKAIGTTMNENKNTIQNGLNKIAEQMQMEVSDKNKSLQLRSELLWWKEAGYSPSTDKSYKELDENILTLVLAYDYSSFIPVVYPKSVDYFLKETYNTIKLAEGQELTLKVLLSRFDTKSEELKQLLPESDTSIGKLTLLNFINGLIWNKYQLTQFENLVGIPLNTKLSPSELTVWLFHDFQLAKILITK